MDAKQKTGFYLCTLPLGEARLRRPDSVERLTFDDLLDRRVKADAVARMVPIEAVQPGDVQVLAARQPDKISAPRINLDRLASVPSVESMLTSTVIRSSVALPEIRELLFFSMTLMPDPATIANFPGLQSLYARRAPINVKLAFDRLPPSLRDLAISRAAMASPDVLSRLTGLKRLMVVDLLPGDSVQPIADLPNLTYLWVGGGHRVKGWASLARCVNIEEAHLMEVQVANLRGLRAWSRLRRLALTGRALKSLQGVEAFEQLESLSLVLVGVADLAPLSELRLLADLQLRYLNQCRDLGPLAALPSLRRLEISQSVITKRDICHVDSLKPLAGAANLEAVILRGTTVDDGDLTPLAALPKLRLVDLGRDIGADVDRLRQARPDLDIRYSPPPAQPDVRTETVGEVTLHYPTARIADWWIFEDLTEVLGVQTNHAAETRVRRAIEKADRELLRRIRFDTEGGAVGIYAKTEADLRAVAALIDEITRGR